MGNFTSDIDICNDAIARIGGKFINSIENPSTTTETLCASMYVKNRQVVLRSAPWNFATKIDTIAKLSETVEGFAAVYKFNNDHVRFLGIPSLGITPADVYAYKIADGKIYLRYSGPDTITVEYIRDVKEVKIYDALFVEAFSLRLAYNLSFRLSGKNTLADRLLAEYHDTLQQAKMIDGQEQKPIRVNNSKWLRKRKSYGSEPTHYSV